MCLQWALAAGCSHRLPGNELLCIAHAFPKRGLLGHRSIMGTSWIVTTYHSRSAKDLGKGKRAILDTRPIKLCHTGLITEA